MLLRLGTLLLVVGIAPSLQAQQASHRDAEWQRKLEQVVEGFHGEVGLYVRHLPSGRTAEIQADTLFPTASMIKVPILLKTLLVGVFVVSYVRAA